MKIYIVTKGIYSDYHIICATPDKEQAERAVKLFSDMWDIAGIEEFDSDDIKAIPDDTCEWVVEFTHHNHELYSIEQNKEKHIFHNNCYYNEFYKRYVVHVNAKDEDHAVKIARDEFTRYLAQELLEEGNE